METRRDGVLGLAWDGAIATVTLNRPESRNAINSAVRLGIPELFDEIAERARVIILRGAGTQAFASGADLRELQEMNQEQARDHYLEFETCLSAVEKCPVPVIGMLHGYVLGGGCELAAACDFRVAASDARFGMPIARMGHQVDLANVRRLMRLVGPSQIKPLLMTDHILGADEARRIGLVHWVVPASELSAFVHSLAGTMASKAPLSLRACKQSLAWIIENPVPRDDEDIAMFCAPLFETQDFKEGTSAFFEKRKPQFTGA